MSLIGMPKRDLKSGVEDLLPRVQAENLDPGWRKQIIEMVGTVLISRFPKMSRQEIEAMFNIKSLRNTRVFKEGREEGMLEIIPKLVVAGLSPEKIAEVTSVPLDQVRAVLESQVDTGGSKP